MKQEANEKQVGGTHYKKSKFQPWDWDRYGVGYLECNAIKYVTRYRDKGGKEDLEKAIHYVDKLIEEAHNYGRGNRVTYPWYDMDKLVSRYTDEWSLDEHQTAVVMLMVYWTQTKALDVAKEHIQSLIDGHSASDVQPSEQLEGKVSE